MADMIIKTFTAKKTTLCVSMMRFINGNGKSFLSYGRLFHIDACKNNAEIIAPQRILFKVIQRII